MSEQVTNGKRVSLTYSIRDAGGQVLEQSDLPVSYIPGGHNELIGGMDEALAGKRPGDEVDLELSPEQSGFGPYDPDLSFTDDLDNVPPQFRHLGAEVPMQSETGEMRTFYVTKIADGRLTVDGNHPLAGKTLTIRVQIREVRDARPGEERTSGIHAVQMPGPTSIN